MKYIFSSTIIIALSFSLKAFSQNTFFSVRQNIYTSILDDILLDVKKSKNMLPVVGFVDSRHRQSYYASGVAYIGVSFHDFKQDTNLLNSLRLAFIGDSISINESSDDPRSKDLYYNSINLDNCNELIDSSAYMSFEINQPLETWEAYELMANVKNNNMAIEEVKDVNLTEYLSIPVVFKYFCKSHVFKRKCIIYRYKISDYRKCEFVALGSVQVW